MNFAFSDEQEEFRSTLRRFLEERAPAGELRRMLAAPATSTYAACGMSARSAATPSSVRTSLMRPRTTSVGALT